MAFNPYENLSPVTATFLTLTVFVAVAAILFQFAGEWIGDKLLSTFNGGILSSGKSVPGPKWTWPNGQFTDKFMAGRQRSEEWRKYGPVYRIWAGPKPEIVLTTPEDIRTFHTDSADHGKPQDGNFGWYFGRVLGRCVGLLEHGQWREMRRVVDPAFKHSSVVNRINITEEDAKNFVDSLKDIFAVGGKEAKDKDQFTVHCASAFTKFPFYFTAEVVYGKMTEAERVELWKLAEKRLALLPYFFKGGFYRTGLLKWWDRAAFDQLQNFLNEWADFNTRIAQSRRAQGIPAPIVSYWDEYLKGNIDLEQITHTLDESLFANLDVTTHVLTWAITLIADHPEVQKELREEIEANKDNLQEYITRSNTHLHRCYYESVRVRPIAIFSIGESAPVVKNFRGILVKPGTMVLVDSLAINVRNPFWGPDSEKYNPDRFKTVKQTDLRYNLFVFGFGHRKCLGQYLAGHMIKAICVHLFSQYEVSVVKGRQGSEYDIDKNTWVPMADVNIELKKLA